MVHFYVDDGLHANPKARAAGLPAMGLWVMSGAYSADQLTEGLVPDWFVRSFAPNGFRLAGVLVQHRLWHGPGDHCDSPNCPAYGSGVPPAHFAFHDWAAVNTRTKASVEKDRAAARDRQRRWAERHANGVSSDSQSSPSQRETSQSVPSRGSAHVGGSVDNYSSAVDLARARLADLGQEPVSKSQAARVVDAILSRAATTPRNAERYVKVALNRDPSEWLQYMLTGKEPA